MWFSQIQPVTDATVSDELPSLLEALPRWRKEKALSYRFEADRYTCARSYLLLKEMLLAHYGIYGDVEFTFGPYGKPFLKAYPFIHFSYSHCRKAVLCAVGDSPLGADVEDIQYDEEIARAAFDESEYLEIRQADNPQDRFTEYWTRKESCLKLTGTGLADDLRMMPDSTLRTVDFKTTAYHDFGVIATIATFKDTGSVAESKKSVVL